METTEKQSPTYKKGGSFLIEETKPEEIFTPEDFTEQHRMIAETTRDFVDNEVMPNIGKLEELDYDLTVKLLRKAGDIGLLSVDIPEEYGGLGLDKTSSMLVAENLGKTGSFAVSHGAHAGIGTLPIVFFGTEQQKKKYLPKFATGELISSYSLSEPGSGSDALSAKTMASLSPDARSYVLNGSKMWLSNAGFAEVYIIFAQVDGDKFTSFILEKNFKGISLGKEEKKMGIKGSSTRALNLDNVQVPVENVVGEIGKGHRVALNILNIGRFKLGAGVIGAAKHVITEAVRYAKARKQFNAPIISFGLIKHKLGEMAIKTFVGESMVYRTAGLIDSVLQNVDNKIHVEDPARGNAAALALKGIEEYAVECSIIKVYASEILDYVVDEGVQVFGGYGFTEEYPVARPYRDSRINRIFEGTNEINRLLIPQMLIRRAMKGELPLMAAAQKMTDELIAPSAGESVHEGLLANEMTLASNAKKIGLLVAGTAFQKYMDKLEHEQEIMWHISDIVMEAYAMESVLLRVKKMEAKNGKDISLYADIGRSFVYETIEWVEGHAKAALAIIFDGDMLRTYLTALRRLLKYTPINSAYIRRAIADKLAEANRYCL